MAAFMQSRPKKQDSIFQILQPERVERVFVELGRRVERHSEVGENAAIKAQLDVINKTLKTPEHCLRCKASYLPEVNYCYRACKMHYGEIVIKNYKRVYSCCGQPPNVIGCVSCMHTSRPEMYELMEKNPFGAFVELSKILVDSGEMKISTEIITDYPKAFLSRARELKLREDKFSRDEIRLEDLVYRINMVVIFPAIVSSIIDL